MGDTGDADAAAAEREQRFPAQRAPGRGQLAGPRSRREPGLDVPELERTRDVRVLNRLSVAVERWPELRALAEEAKRHEARSRRVDRDHLGSELGGELELFAHAEPRRQRPELGRRSPIARSEQESVE